MKLLFDHNLSPKLVARLADLYPESAHVFALGLGSSNDTQVWDYARKNGFSAIVTRDADYGDLVAIEGFPPKVVLIRTGNVSTREIETLLRSHREAIENLTSDPEAGLLTLI